jgi:hypothetical protein
MEVTLFLNLESAKPIAMASKSMKFPDQDNTISLQVNQGRKLQSALKLRPIRLGILCSQDQVITMSQLMEYTRTLRLLLWERNMVLEKRRTPSQDQGHTVQEWI